MTEPSRRRLLAATGVAAVGAIAGCLSDGDDPEENGDESDGTDDDPDDSDGTGDEPTDPFADIEGTVLGDISVDNLHDEAHTVDVIVEIDGETQAWVTEELEARSGGVTLEREWDEGGQFRVRVRLDNDRFREVTPADWNDPDCISVLVIVDAEGEVRIAGDTTTGACAV